MERLRPYIFSDVAADGSLRFLHSGVRRERLLPGFRSVTKSMAMVVAVLLSVFPSACTFDSIWRDTAPEPTGGSWQEQVSRLQKLTGWRVRGKISLWRDGEDFRAPFIWEYRSGHSQIYLLDAFGWPRGRIEWSADGAGYFSQSGKRRRFASIHDFSLRQFGVDLPLAAIRYWMTGVPRVRDEIKNLHFSSAKGITDFEQSGWHVQYLARQDVKGYSLPAKMRVEKQNAGVLFLISGWNNLVFSEEGQEHATQ